MTECILMVDLEGVVTDNSHRLHLMKSGDWDAYEEAALEDPCHPTFRKFLNSINWTTFEIVLVTGRYEKYRHRTYEQLKKFGIYPEHLLMRDNFDIPKTKEPELKLQFLEEVRRIYADYPNAAIIAMEDRDDVVEALRNAGIDCWQTRNGQPG